MTDTGARLRLLEAAGWLFQRQGFAATGTAQILELARAPKGSMYFHFPGGKEELACAVIARAAHEMEDAFAVAAGRGSTAADLVANIGKILGRWLSGSDYLAGCPITTVTLEQVPGSPDITAASRRAFDSWHRRLVDELVARNLDPDRAPRLAQMILAAFEGAFILARVQQSLRPFNDVSAELQLLLATTDEH